MKRLIAIFVGLTAAGLIAYFLTRERPPPNIVLVSIDTLRFDYLGVYGYPDQEISPTIDWLAGNGTVFEQAMASAGTTVPSHGTMLTGLYPRHHGARSNHHALYPEVPTLAQALTAEHYQTGAFVSARFMGRAAKLTRGFEQNNIAELLAIEGLGVQAGEETLAQLFQWVDARNPEAPLFAFVHLWEVHTPFEASDWARSRSESKAPFLETGLTAQQWQKQHRQIRSSPELQAALGHLYAGQVKRVDGVLKAFFDGWRERGLLENTVVIFTADHGERLGENGRFGHGPTHDEHVIRVPLIIADFRDPEPSRIETRVGTIDIAPTVAELAGLEKRFNQVGYSLLDTDDLDPERPYYAEVELRTTEIDADKAGEAWYDPDAVAVWAGNMKLESRLGSSWLLETNAGNELPEPVNPGSEAIMFNYLSGLVDSFRQAELDLTASQLSEEQLEELRGLGYTQ